MHTTFESQSITEQTRRSYPKLTADQLASQLSFKTDTLIVFEITEDDQLVEKRMKVSQGIMLEVHADGTETPANMTASYHAGWFHGKV